MLGRRWVISELLRNGVVFTLILSLVIFAVFMAGSIPDPGFSDSALFLLLLLLRYSSLLLSAIALLAMGYSVRRLVYYPSLKNGLSLFLYFAAGILSVGLAMLYSFIVAASEGNV